MTAGQQRRTDRSVERFAVEDHLCVTRIGTAEAQAVHGNSIFRDLRNIIDGVQRIVGTVDDVEPVAVLVVRQSGRSEDAARLTAVDGEPLRNDGERDRVADWDAYQTAGAGIRYVERGNAVVVDRRNEGLTEWAVPRSVAFRRQNLSAGRNDRRVVRRKIRRPNGVVRCKC